MLSNIGTHLLRGQVGYSARAGTKKSENYFYSYTNLYGTRVKFMFSDLFVPTRVQKQHLLPFSV